MEPKKILISGPSNWMMIEKGLYKSKDPAMYYLGSIIPHGLHIGEGFLAKL